MSNKLEVYIACAGLSTRIKSNKLLTKFQGYTLPCYQVKLLNEKNITPILISNEKNTQEMIKSIEGRFYTIETYTPHQHNVNELLFLFDIEYFRNDFMYLCGDLYYTRKALNEMLNTNNKLVFFGRKKANIYSNRPELFGLKAKKDIHHALYTTLKLIINQSLWEIPNKYHYPIKDIEECLDYDYPEDKQKLEAFIKYGNRNKESKRIKRHLLNFFETLLPRRIKEVMRKW